jgi:hypothetical protein
MTVIQNNLWKSATIIESINPKTISEKDLEKIAEIEQDTWAYSIWEYVKCNKCVKIFSKNDIFWDLPKEIYNKTVLKIEEYFQIEYIKCPCCNKQTQHIYWKEYILDIVDRYKNTVNSFLTLYRSWDWEIRGFFDWYIDDFDSLYEREFALIKDNISKEKLILEIVKKIWYSPDLFLVCSALWMEQWYHSFNILYQIIKWFFDKLNISEFSELVWIAEVIIWSNTHWIYHSVWATKLWLSLKWSLLKHNSYETDIFVHNNIVSDYVTSMSWNVKEFLKLKWNSFKEVLLT